MFKNKKTIAAIVVLCVILIAIVGFLTVKGSQYQTAQLDGYSIMVPQSWTVTEEESVLKFLDNNEEAGRFELLYVKHDIADIPGVLGYEVENPEVRESDQYSTKVYEIRFDNGEEKICQYVFDGLPNFPPYHAVLTLKNEHTRAAERILKHVVMPKLANMPEKPIEELTDEFLEQAVYTISRDEAVYAYRMSRLDRLIQSGAEQPADKSSGLHILSCEVDDEGKTVSDWHYLFVGGGEKRLYTYELGEDGKYFYRNNPKLIRDVKKEVSEEENYTRYYADGELILEAPYNAYAENKEALLMHKDTVIGEDSSVSDLVKKTVPHHATMEGVTMETDSNPYGLSLQYVLDKPETYITDGKLDEDAFYQNALVLFSLVNNVDWIQMDIRTGEDVYTVKYDRKKAESQFDEQDLRTFTENEKKFEEFTESVPQVAPPTEEHSGNHNDGTRAIATRVVSMSSSSMVKHPKTGKMVSVKPYAERYGVSQYLDKPITVTLYEKVEAGKVTMWASASCGGAQIGTYPVSSRAEFESLVGMVG